MSYYADLTEEQKGRLHIYWTELAEEFWNKHEMRLFILGWDKESFTGTWLQKRIPAHDLAHDLTDQAFNSFTTWRDRILTERKYQDV